MATIFTDLATGVAKARQPRELDHILHSVSTGTYAIQEMAGWRNKKGKSGSVATLSSSNMAQRARRIWLAKQKRLSRYRDVICAILSHFGNPHRPAAICVAVPQQLSRYGEASTCAMQAIAAHLSVPRPSPNHGFGRDSCRQCCAIGPLFVQRYCDVFAIVYSDVTGTTVPHNNNFPGSKDPVYIILEGLCWQLGLTVPQSARLYSRFYLIINFIYLFIC